MFSRLLLLKRHSEKKNAESSINSPISTSNSESPAPSDASDSKVSAENLPDVHPSLVEYLSLLPPSQHPHSSAQEREAAEQMFARPFSSDDFYSPPSIEMQNMYVSPPAMSPEDSNMGGYMPLYPNTGNASTGTFTSEPIAMNSGSPGDFLSVDLMMRDSGPGIPGIDQQWRSFMRDSGLLDHGLSP